MIIIIRHGQTLWNIQNRKQGHKNSNLTLTGRMQGKLVAELLKKKIDIEDFKIFISPLKRVADYKKIVLKNMNLKKKVSISKSNLLKEHCFGIWEGKNEKEIEKLFPNQLKYRNKDKWNYIVPRGESYKILHKRVGEFLKKKINKKKKYIIFTHEMVSKVLRGHLCKLKPKDILKLNHKNNEIYIYTYKKIKKFKI